MYMYWIVTERRVIYCIVYNLLSLAIGYLDKYPFTIFLITLKTGTTLQTWPTLPAPCPSCPWSAVRPTTAPATSFPTHSNSTFWPSKT